MKKETKEKLDRMLKKGPFDENEYFTVGEIREILEDPECQNLMTNIEIVKDEPDPISDKLTNIADWLSALDDMQSYLCDIDNSMDELVQAIKELKNTKGIQIKDNH